MHVQWQPYSAVWHTYDITAPPPDTHLAAFFKGDKGSTLRSEEITVALRAATTIIGQHVGFTPDNISARLMRAGGTMALLMACINTYTIRLVGRWRSYAILRYLHTAAQMFTEGIAAQMVQYGDYALIPPTHRG